jgi:hypothetical protein
MKTNLILILLFLSTFPAFSEHKVKLYLPDTVLEYDIKDITNVSFDGNSLLNMCKIYTSDKPVFKILTCVIKSIDFTDLNLPDPKLMITTKSHYYDYYLRDTFLLSKIDSIIFLKENILFGHQYTNASISFSPGINYKFRYIESSYQQGGNSKNDTIITDKNFDNQEFSISVDFDTVNISNASIEHYYCFNIDPKGIIFICQDQNGRSWNDNKVSEGTDRSDIIIYIDTIKHVIDSITYEHLSGNYHDQGISSNTQENVEENMTIKNLQYFLKPDGTIQAILNNNEINNLNYYYHQRIYLHYGGGLVENYSDFLNFTEINPNATITIEIW